MSLMDMKEFKDWKGNIITEKDTIVLYKTQPTFSNSKLVIFDIGSGKTETISEYEHPKDLWDKSYEVNPFLVDGKLFMKTTDEIGNNIIQSIFMIWFFKQDSDLVCIKGLSDNKEDYYNKKTSR